MYIHIHIHVHGSGIRTRKSSARAHAHTHTHVYAYIYTCTTGGINAIKCDIIHPASELDIAKQRKGDFIYFRETPQVSICLHEPHTYVCACMNAGVCTYLCMRVHASTYLCMCVYACMGMHTTRKFSRISTNAYTHICCGVSHIVPKF